MVVLQTWYSFCTRIKCMNGSEIKFAVIKDYHLYNGYDSATTTSDLAQLWNCMHESYFENVPLLTSRVSTEVDSVSCFQDT